MSETRSVDEVPGSDPMLGIVARAYADAVLAGADMRVAAEAIEAMRAAMLREPVLTVVWDALDDTANRMAEFPTLLPALVTLRENWRTIAMAEEKRQLAAGRAAERETAWLSRFATAVGDFRLDYAEALLEDGPHLPVFDEPSAAALMGWVARARLRRWKEARPLYAYLARATALAAPHRARALAIEAEVDIVIERNEAGAKDKLDAAGRLVEADWYVEFAWAVLHLEGEGEDEDRLKEAERHLSLALALAPQVASIHSSFADLAAKRKDLSAAEAHHERATRCRIGGAMAWENMISFWSHRDLFSERYRAFPRAIERVRAAPLHRLSAGYALLAAGAACRDNAEPEQALEWYRQAADVDPKWSDPLLSTGEILQSLGRLEEAAVAFERAAALEPDPRSGQTAWAMASAADARGDRKGFCEHCLGALERLERDAQWRQYLTSRLEDQAAAFYQNDDDPERALSIYGRLREILGESYEADYRSLRGHLFYYKRRYGEAAAEYRKASLAAPAEPWPWFNAALALESDPAPAGRAARLTEARDRLRRAVELAPENERFREKHDWFGHVHAFVSREGETVLDLQPESPRIRVRLPRDLLPAVILNELLTPETLEKLANLRQVIKDETGGFVLPGVRFSDISADEVLELPSGPSVDHGLTIIEVMGRPVQALRIEPEHLLVPADAAAPPPPGWRPAESLPVAWRPAGWVPRTLAAAVREAGSAEAPLDVLLRAVGGVVRAHLPELLGPTEAQGLAQTEAPLAKRIADVARLNRLTALLRERLARNGRIGPLGELTDLVADDNAALEFAGLPPVPDRITPKLKLPASQAEWLTAIEGQREYIQKLICDATGFVVSGTLRLEIDEAMAGEEAELHLQRGTAPVRIPLPYQTDIWIKEPIEALRAQFPDARPVTGFLGSIVPYDYALYRWSSEHNVTIAYAKDLLLQLLARQLAAHAPLLLDADAAAFNCWLLRYVAKEPVSVAEKLLNAEELAARLRATAGPGRWQGNFLACVERALLAPASAPVPVASDAKVGA